MGNSQSGIAGRKAIVLIVVGGLVLLFGWLIFSKLTYKSDFRKTADIFVKEVSNKNVDQSYDMLSAEQKSSIPKDSWREQLGASFNNGTGDPKFERTESVADPYKIYGDTGAERLFYRFNLNGNTYVMSVLVAKQENLWRVHEFLSEQL